MNRLLLSVAIVLSMGLASCSNQSPPAPEGSASSDASGPRVVHVYNWTNYIAEDTLANFEKETGIKVVYEMFDTNETLEEKLRAGGGTYDVVFPSARPFAQRFVQDGMLLPLDRATLPNRRNLDQLMMVQLEDVDPGNEHVLPYLWGTTGLGVNVDKVRAILGADAALESWSLLFDPATAAKLAECGIAMLDDPQVVFAAALMHNGRNPNDLTADQTTLAVETLKAVRPHVRYFDSSKYLDELVSGDICIAVGFSGDIMQARDRAVEENTGARIEYLLPKEGTLRFLDVMAIPKDAPHPAEAHAFINYILDAKVAASITNFVSYGNGNAASTEFIDPAIRNDPAIFPPVGLREKLVEPRTLPDEVNAERDAAWAEIVGAPAG